MNAHRFSVHNRMMNILVAANFSKADDLSSVSIYRVKDLDVNMEEGELDLTFITERIISVSFTSSCSNEAYSNNLKDVTQMLKLKHGDKYLVLNLSEKCYELSKLNTKVVDMGWPELYAPPLDKMCSICKTMESWLNNNPLHVVVIHCRGGKGRIGVVLSSYMHFTNVSLGADQALDLFVMKKFFDDKVSALMQPSQKRYVTFLSELLSGVQKMNAAPLFLHYVVLHGIQNSNFDTSSVFQPFIQVYQAMQHIYTSGNYNIVPREQHTICLVVEPPQLIKGDVMIKCYHKSFYSEDSNVIFRLQFHTGSVHDQRLLFGKEELDYANNDDKFPSYGKTELIFSRSPENLPGTQENLEAFVAELNKNDMNLKFTVEFSQEAINFLDLSVMLSREGLVTTKFYRKQTAANTMLRASSAYPKPLLKSIPYGEYICTAVRHRIFALLLIFNIPLKSIQRFKSVKVLRLEKGLEYMNIFHYQVKSNMQQQNYRIESMLPDSEVKAEVNTVNIVASSVPYSLDSSDGSVPAKPESNILLGESKIITPRISLKSRADDREPIFRRGGSECFEDSGGAKITVQDTGSKIKRDLSYKEKAELNQLLGGFGVKSATEKDMTDALSKYSGTDHMVPVNIHNNENSTFGVRETDILDDDVPNHDVYSVDSIGTLSLSEGQQSSSIGHFSCHKGSQNSLLSDDCYITAGDEHNHNSTSDLNSNIDHIYERLYGISELKGVQQPASQAPLYMQNSYSTQSWVHHQQMVSSHSFHYSSDNSDLGVSNLSTSLCDMPETSVVDPDLKSCLNMQISTLKSEGENPPGKSQNSVTVQTLLNITENHEDTATSPTLDIDQSIEQLNQLILELDPSFELVPVPVVTTANERPRYSSHHTQLEKSRTGFQGGSQTNTSLIRGRKLSFGLYDNNASDPQFNKNEWKRSPEDDSASCILLDHNQSKEVDDLFSGRSKIPVIPTSDSASLSVPVDKRLDQKSSTSYKDDCNDVENIFNCLKNGNEIFPPTPAFPVLPETIYDRTQLSAILMAHNGFRPNSDLCRAYKCCFGLGLGTGACTAVGLRVIESQQEINRKLVPESSVFREIAIFVGFLLFRSKGLDRPLKPRFVVLLLPVGTCLNQHVLAELDVGRCLVSPVIDVVRIFEDFPVDEGVIRVTKCRFNNRFVRTFYRSVAVVKGVTASGGTEKQNIGESLQQRDMPFDEFDGTSTAELQNSSLDTTANFAEQSDSKFWVNSPKLTYECSLKNRTEFPVTNQESVEFLNSEKVVLTNVFAPETSNQDCPSTVLPEQTSSKIIQTNYNFDQHGNINNNMVLNKMPVSFYASTSGSPKILRTQFSIDNKNANNQILQHIAQNQHSQPPLPEKKRISESERSFGSSSPSSSGFSSPHSGSTISIPFPSFLPEFSKTESSVPECSTDSSPDNKHMTVKFVQDTSRFWYKPDISREQAIAVLKDKEPGSFIVRDSHSFRGAYGLAMKVATPPSSVHLNKKVTDLSNELVRHFLIECVQKGVRLKGCPNEPYFGSLTALIYQHSITPLALPCKLLIPDKDHLEEIADVPQTAANSATELLKQGAACNVWYLNSVEMESLTGYQAVQKALSITEMQDSPPISTVVHFKVSSQGITLTDNQRKLFFRRHYPANTVIFCALDPQDRKWTKDGLYAKVFGFVARKGNGNENICHLFAEHDPEQPASAIVNFVSKVMIGSQKKL
ncbi:tensin-3-like [Gastrophryne carolinensis]